MMEGGNLISEGGYGCIYKPEIKCSGKIGSNKMVSKLQKKNDIIEKNSKKNELTYSININ